MKKLYKLTKRAVKKDEVPVACLIVRKNRIIASSYNKKIKNNDPTAHAEILCIRKAAKKLRTPILEDCEVYITLEPCEMCKTVIKESRIKKVYYLLENNKNVNKKSEFIKIDSDKNEEFKQILVEFFKNKR